MKNIKRTFHWDNFVFNLDYLTIITKTLITKGINVFTISRLDKIKDNEHIIALFRAETNQGLYFTLGRLVRLNKDEQKYFITLMKDTFSLKSNDYKDIVITKIIISYGIREGLAPIVAGASKKSYCSASYN